MRCGSQPTRTAPRYPRAGGDCGSTSQRLPETRPAPRRVGVRGTFGLGKSTPDALHVRCKQREREAVQPDRTARADSAGLRDVRVVRRRGIEKMRIQMPTRGVIETMHPRSPLSHTDQLAIRLRMSVRGRWGERDPTRLF